MLLYPGIFTIKGYFDKDEIEQMKTFVQRHRMIYGTTAADGKTAEDRAKARSNGSEYRKSQVYFISRKDTYVCEPFVKFDSVISYANKTYFDQPIGDVDKWEGYQFGEYDESYQGFYKRHKDAGGSEGLRGRKISVSLQLTDSNEYEGGNLMLYPREDIEIQGFREAGTITVFLSTIMHEVTPVTKGTRNSLVTWVH